MKQHWSMVLVPQVFSVSSQRWITIMPSSNANKAVKSKHTRNNTTRMQAITANIPIATDQQPLTMARSTKNLRYTTIVPVIVQEGTERTLH